MEIARIRIRIKSRRQIKMAEGVGSYVSATGRRKEAVARIRLFKGNAQMVVNDKPVSGYFPGVANQKLYQKPLEITKLAGEYTATVKIAGGGYNAQLEALIHGLARAIEILDKEKYRPLLKKSGFLTRDSRSRERRKYGHAQKARAMKQSPKR